MSDTTPDRPPGGGMVQALRVPRYATVGLVTGVGVAALVYAVRVFELLGPVAATPAGPTRYPFVGPSAWFLLLAVVLAVTTALLVTTVLTGVRALRLARRESDA